MNKLPIVEQFLSFQGEAGQPGQLAYFIRTVGCNLACQLCDSKYASRKGAKYKMIDIDTLITLIIDKKVNFVVITGGCPLLYKKQLKELIQKIYFKYNSKIKFCIETNGTISPIKFNKPLSVSCFNIEPLSIFYNISPKTSWSGNNPKKAIKLNVLKKFVKENSIFKFVIDSDKDWKEMEEVIKKVKIPIEKVYIMPQGRDNKTVKKNALKYFNRIIESRYNLSPRLQIWLFGKKRGV